MKWIFLFFILSACFSQAQITSTEGIPLECDNFYGIDDFVNIYYSTDNVLYKNSVKDEFQFYDIQLGDIASVDIINPLKILVFYRDTQTLVFLDNRLNEQLRINFNTLKPQRFIEHARLAGERRLWLYNLDMSRVELYDYVNNKVINSTTPLSSNAIAMQSDYNFCHVITEKGIVTFNSYASETSRIKEDVSLPVAFDFEQLGFKTDHGWKWYRFDREFRLRETELTTPISQENTPESLYLKGGKLYIYSQKRLYVSTINLKKL
ncbi:MAG: hypothetical protein ACSHWW_03095 [Nonlabens sp.]|uniref:hypothetical protein n=1 Tax=Nonlabens sp. TaxID=1888209 RepID=UPI003EFB0BAF